MKRTVAILILFVFAACQADGPRTVQLDRDFELPVGEQAHLAGSGLSVKFLSVIHDSRCPSGVDCFHQGEAVIEVLATRDDRGKRLSLSTSPPRDTPPQDRYGPYRIQLTGLDPYPGTDRPGAGGSRATLRITR